MAAELRFGTDDQARKLWAANDLCTGLSAVNYKLECRLPGTSRQFLRSLQDNLAMLGGAQLNGPALADMINKALDQYTEGVAEVIASLPLLMGTLFSQDKEFAYWILEATMGDPTLDFEEHYGIAPQTWGTDYLLN